MKTHDSLIIKILIKNDKILTNSIRKINKGKYPNILEYLNSRYNDSDCMTETIRRIKYKLEERPVCKWCGGHVSFNGYHKGSMHYSACCCSSCHAKYTKDKRFETNIKKYGRKNFGSVEKVKEYWISHYGVDNPAKTDFVKKKMRETNLRKYGFNCSSKSEIVKEKTKQTCLKRYGVEYAGQIEEAKEKSKKTCLEKYGAEYYIGSKDCLEKTIEFSRQNYNVDWFTKSEEIKNKAKKTMLRRYGVEYSMQIPKNREYMSYLMSSYEMQERRYNTMKRNHTFNSSSTEEELFLYIKSRFPTVVRQYKDKNRYPYFCDFYIPELDYFIEFQGYYTHGKHPFDPNSNEDLQLIEYYKKKYGGDCQPITIWSIKDVEKRDCAKEHNLNFKEVWSLEDGKNFVNDLYDFYINIDNKQK